LHRRARRRNATCRRI